MGQVVNQEHYDCGPSFDPVLTLAFIRNDHYKSCCGTLILFVVYVHSSPVSMTTECL